MDMSFDFDCGDDGPRPSNGGPPTPDSLGPCHICSNSAVAPCDHCGNLACEPCLQEWHGQHVCRTCTPVSMNIMGDIALSSHSPTPSDMWGPTTAAARRMQTHDMDEQQETVNITQTQPYFVGIRSRTIPFATELTIATVLAPRIKGTQAYKWAVAMRISQRITVMASMALRSATANELAARADSRLSPSSQAAAPRHEVAEDAASDNCRKKQRMSCGVLEHDLIKK